MNRNQNLPPSDSPLKYFDMNKVYAIMNEADPVKFPPLY